jgi:hypothetical protein
LGIPIISISYVEGVDEFELNIYGVEELGRIVRDLKILAHQILTIQLVAIASKNLKSILLRFLKTALCL